MWHARLPLKPRTKQACHLCLAQEDGDGGGGQLQGTVLEPCKLGVTADLAGGAGDVALRLSDLRLNLSPDVAELAAALQASVLEPLIQPSPDRRAAPLAVGGADQAPALSIAFLAVKLETGCPSSAAPLALASLTPSWWQGFGSCVEYMSASKVKARVWLTCLACP